MSQLTQQDIKDLEMQSQIRETLEMQNTVLNLTVNCFNTCSKDFYSGTLNDTERLCLSKCSSQFWGFFKRAQSNAQEVMKERIKQQMGV
jgi:hypothetical protein